MYGLLQMETQLSIFIYFYYMLYICKIQVYTYIAVIYTKYEWCLSYKSPLVWTLMANLLVSVPTFFFFLNFKLFSRVWVCWFALWFH